MQWAATTAKPHRSAFIRHSTPAPQASPALTASAASGSRSKIISPATLLSALGREQINLVKIDVEGFEHRVVESIAPLLREGRIKVLLLDYHRQILQAQGVDPMSVEQNIIRSGMRPEQPPVGEPSGYRLYRW
ncbi:MAG: FkbM family methyltransferase [Candidatus Binataceae bacterium]